MNHHYSVLIQWLEEDNCYVVNLPEFGSYAHTHGNTYIEAAKHAQEVLEMLIDSYQEDGLPLLQPITLAIT